MTPEEIIDSLESLKERMEWRLNPKGPAQARPEVTIPALIADINKLISQLQTKPPSL